MVQKRKGCALCRGSGLIYFLASQRDIENGLEICCLCLPEEDQGYEKGPKSIRVSTVDLFSFRFYLARARERNIAVHFSFFRGLSGSFGLPPPLFIYVKAFKAADREKELI